MLTSRQLATMLGVSKPYAHDLLQKSGISFQGVGNGLIYLYDVGDLYTWLRTFDPKKAVRKIETSKRARELILQAWHTYGDSTEWKKDYKSYEVLQSIQKSLCKCCTANDLLVDINRRVQDKFLDVCKWDLSNERFKKIACTYAGVDYRKLSKAAQSTAYLEAQLKLFRLCNKANLLERNTSCVAN